MAIRVGSRSREISDIDVTPMADVMIVLLVIFTVATPLIVAEGVRPPAAEHGLLGDGEPVVLIDREGRLRLQGEPAGDLDWLAASVRAELSRRPAGSRTVRVEADRDLAFDRVRELIDACREAGAERVALVTVSEGAS